jgi:hypothetical protein
VVVRPGSSLSGVLGNGEACARFRVATITEGFTGIYPFCFGNVGLQGPSGRAAAIPQGIWGEVMTVARHQVSPLRASGRWLSRNDLRIIVMAQVVGRLSQSGLSAVTLAVLEREGDTAEQAIGNFNGDN